MCEDKPKASYSLYLDGQAMYSNGKDGEATLTDDGWIVPLSRIATEHERMVGAAMMRKAVISDIQTAQPLNTEMARDLAHWLLMLNDGNAAGVFVPLVPSADGIVTQIDLATAETIKARVAIANELNTLGVVGEHYRNALIESLKRADLGRLAGLAAPGKEVVLISDEDAFQTKKNNRPVPAQRHQESEILRVIRELGYDPKNLPKRKIGKKRWVKAEVRELLEFTEKTFDLAWERLRTQEEIIESITPSN